MEGKGKVKGKNLGGKKSKSKLSLKRKLQPASSDQDESDNSVGDHRSSSFDFLRAITGEISLNQSDDFREAKKTSRPLPGKKVADSKLLKKSLKVKSKQKPSSRNASSSTEPSLSVTGSHGNKSRGHVLDDGNKKVKGCLLDEENKHNEAERNNRSDEADKSVTSCAVILSKLTPLASDTVEIGTNKESPRKKTTQISAESSTSERTSRKCPVCQKVLTDISGSQQMDQHVNLCLKRHFSAAGDTSEDEHLARQIQEREQEKIVEEKLTEDGFYLCQFCHKDLSKMNSTRRLQHANRCIDVYEKEQQEQERIQRNAAKKLIADCPMCGMPLNTKLQRESHLKRCARELHVSSAQLIELVRVQEEEIANHMLTEQQSDINAQSTSEAQVAIPKPKGRPKKKKKREDLDEDTQLAIAMSASIAVPEATAGSESNAPVKRGKGRKKKTVEKEVPVLLVRSEAERQRILEHRLASLVAPQDAQEDLAQTPALIHSKVAKKQRKRHGPNSGVPPTLIRQSSLLWELSAQNDSEQVSASPFYVSQLKPNIGPGETSKPKRGRPPKKKRDEDVTDIGSSQVITSTLQVLMDLEEEGAHASPPEQIETQTSGFLDGRRPSTSREPVGDHERMMLDQLSKLVNNEMLSDVKIQTADKSLVHAHQFLLQLRCPKLMQDLTEQSNQSVCSLDVSEKVLLSTLKYVYSGSIEVDGDCALSVVQFAQKYHLPELAIACQQILKIRTTPHKARNTPHKASRKDDITGDKEGEKKDEDDEENDDDEDDDDEYKEKDINELLQSLWDDSEDESKSSSSRESGNHGNDIDEEEMEEIYEYASTQARLCKQSVTSEGLTLRQSSVDLGPKVRMTSVNVDIMTNSAASTSGKVNQAKQDTLSEKLPNSSSLVNKASDSQSDIVLSVTGRYTRRGWKPISNSKEPQMVGQVYSKKSPKKVQKKPDTNTSKVSPSSSSSNESPKKVKKKPDAGTSKVAPSSSSSKESPKKAQKKPDADTSKVARSSSSKESPKKAQKKPDLNTSKTPSASNMAIDDDYNDQDVEMEDVSEDVEYEAGRRRDNESNVVTPVSTSVTGNSGDGPGESASNLLSHVTRQSSKKTMPEKQVVSPKKSRGKEREATEVLDLTSDSPDVSPVATKSSSHKKSTKKSQANASAHSCNKSPSLRKSQKVQVPPAESTQSSITKTDTVLKDTAEDGGTENGASRDHLNASVDDEEDDDETDTSWIIPSTPPLRTTKQMSFVPPQKKAPQSRLSKAGTSSSTLMASTPMDARNRMSTLIGNTFLPKISPVKIVLEKMVFDASNPVINSTAEDTEGCVTKKVRKGAFGNMGKTKKSADEQTTSQIAKKVTLQNAKKPTDDSELNVNRRLTRQRSLSEQSACDSSPSSRSTRSASQSPARQTSGKKSTEMSLSKISTPGRLSTIASPKRNIRNGTSQSTPKRNKKHSRNLTSPKLSQNNRSSPTTSKGNSESTTTVRRTRRNSFVGSDKDTPNTSVQRASPIVIPDAPDVATPVVVSDESPSPTPSPTFGNSSATSKGSPPKEDEELVGKPSKRKRKQSMPMRSPDKLQLTSGDAAVSVGTVTPPTGKLKLNTKLKQRTKLPYKSPAPRTKKYPSTYHPLKKKYKSFTPVGRQVLMRRRTRSVAKEASSVGNRSIGDSNKITSPVVQNSERMGADDNDKSKDRESINDGQTSKPDAGEGVADNAVEDAACHVNGDDDVSIVASSSPEKQANGTAEIQDEGGLFAFDFEDGGFDDGFPAHNISHHSNQTNGGEKEHESQNNTAKVNFSLDGDHILSRVSELPSPPASKVVSPRKNNNHNLNNNLPIEASKVLASSINGSPINGSNPDGTSTRVRSPPEVRIPQIRRDTPKDFWANYTKPSARRAASINIPSTPVIAEKVVVVQNFAPSSQYYASQENGEVMSLTNQSLVPSHRQATASPTLRDHHFSPTSSITSQEEAVATGGYFGVGSDSFMQEEVIETSPMREDEEQEEDVFVPPACSITKTPNVAIVRPTPVRPNIDELYHPPAPITPMPNYDDMNTPALRKETCKYGLKPLAKKKARLKLKEIYQYTHQVLETSVDGEDVPESKNEKQPSKKKNDKETTKPKSKKPKTGSKGQGSNSAAPTTGGSAGDNGSKGKTIPSKPPTKPKEAGGESSGDTSDALSYNDCPEDSILDDDEMPMSQPRKSRSSGLSKNPEEAIMRYIKGNEELYHKILMYEPLFIKEFQKELKEAGIVCSMLQLKAILDKQCITFRAEANVNRHVRKSKKKKIK
ncbi:LOW QUALITY PROTEIN: uncharacterized protein [Amphiura filiformis]|uniref:LOW QUALITY PROTEIN: uncharacterized protein n=1 Tax=Amphiura filiformis TaxID=82378 RepID=UPI003B219792